MAINNKHITVNGHFVRAYNYVIIGLMYLVFGLISSYIINMLSPKLLGNESELRLAVEIILEVAVTILFSYVINRIIEKIRLPMAGTKQVQEEVISEMQGGVIAFSIFTLQVKLRSKIQYFFYGKVEDPELVSLGLSEI